MVPSCFRFRRESNETESESESGEVEAEPETESEAAEAEVEANAAAAARAIPARKSPAMADVRNGFPDWNCSKVINKLPFDFRVKSSLNTLCF